MRRAETQTRGLDSLILDRISSHALSIYHVQCKLQMTLLDGYYFTLQFGDNSVLESQETKNDSPWLDLKDLIKIKK